MTKNAKTLVTRTPTTVQARGEGWLDLEHAAMVEVTSQDKDFLIESSLSIEPRQGWRSAEPRSQTIRLIFDQPQELKRISLVFEDDEITIFSQRDHFRLLSSHHVQKGPAFPHPMDVSIDGSTGEVRVRSTENGKDKVQTKHLDLPPDLANGLILTILKNIRPDTPETKLSRFSACAGEICRTKLAPYGCHRGNAEYGVILDCSGQWLQLSSMRLRIGLGIGGFRLLAHRPMTSGR